MRGAGERDARFPSCCNAMILRRFAPQCFGASPASRDGVESLRAVSERHAAPVAIDDTTFASLKFQSGVTGVLTTMFATQQLWRVQVFGDKGWAEVRDQDRFEMRLIEGDTIVEDMSGTDIERAELEAFADTITDGTPFLVPVDDAIHGIEVLAAITRAAKDGSEVTLG